MTNTIYRFQLSQGIIDSPYDDGAGYYGPKTRSALKEILYSNNTPVVTSTSTDEDIDDSDSTTQIDNQADIITQVEVSIFDTKVVE